jgi:hypothetical protein
VHDRWSVVVGVVLGVRDDESWMAVRWLTSGGNEYFKVKDAASLKVVVSEARTRNEHYTPKNALPVLQLHGQPVVDAEAVHVLERVVRVAALRVEEPGHVVVELVGVGVMAGRLPRFVLVVGIGALVDEDLRDLLVAVLRGPT